MSKAIKKHEPIYSILDDVTPLYQIFHADEYILKSELDGFKSFITKNKLDSYYNIVQPKNYSQPNNCGGYEIINPAVWNIVLSILGEQIKNSKHIIEFSRGYDVKYNELLGIENKDIYKKSFECLCKTIGQNILENSLIININAPLSVRKQRNLERFKDGGHLVAEETMDSIYKDDVFVCDNNNCLRIKNVDIPVFFVKNNTTSSNENIEEFLWKEYKKALNYY